MQNALPEKNCLQYFYNYHGISAGKSTIPWSPFILMLHSLDIINI